MDGACVYEESTAIHELTQGIQMAQQLWYNAEERDELIKKILSSYEKTLLVLKSCDSAGQPMLPALPAPGLPEFITSPGSEELKFDQPFAIQQGQNGCKKR